MKHIFYLYLILIFFLIPSLANAQSKPKRDTSKDRSVIAAKKQKEGTRRGAVFADRKSNSRKAVAAKQGKRKASYKRKASHKRKYNVARSYSASYLTVNRQSISLSSTLSQNGGVAYFDVDTDGKEWTVIGLPYWCKMKKYYNGFLLEYEENSSRYERKTWFVVKCDGQEVQVNLSQPAIHYEFSANISAAYIKHNVYSSSLGCYCMEIHATVTIMGAAEDLFKVYTYIIDKRGHFVTAKPGYSSYIFSSSNPIIYGSGEVTPSTNKSQSYNLVWLLPNNALDLRKKKNELCCKIRFWHSGKGYLPDYSIYFKAKSKSGTITTEDY